MRWQWHQLDLMQIICTSLQTDNHASTSPLSFYRSYALPVAQPTDIKAEVVHIMFTSVIWDCYVSNIKGIQPVETPDPVNPMILFWGTRVCLYVRVIFRSICTTVFMVALCNRADHYIFALLFLSSFFLSFFPGLISAVGDWMSTILPHMVWP